MYGKHTHTMPACLLPRSPLLIQIFWDSYSLEAAFLQQTPGCFSIQQSEQSSHLYCRSAGKLTIITMTGIKFQLLKQTQQMTYLTFPCILLLKKLKTREGETAVLRSQISPLGHICHLQMQEAKTRICQVQRTSYPFRLKTKTSIFFFFKIAKPSPSPALLLLWFQKHTFLSEQKEVIRTSLK